MNELTRAENEASMWERWSKKWIAEGHLPEDIALITKLVREKDLTEDEGRGIIDAGLIDVLENLMTKSVISRAEYYRLEKTFQRVVVDSPLGEAELIPTLEADGPRRKRTAVLAQEFRGIFSPKTDRELVLTDPQTRLKLATLGFNFEGYRILVVDYVFTIKRERSEKYAELLFSEMLRRYPGIRAVAFDITAYDLNELREAVGRRARREELIRQTRAYKIATQFGFHNFRVRNNGGRINEFGIRLTAVR